MRTIVDGRDALVAAVAFGSQTAVAQTKKIDLRTKEGVGGGQGSVEVPRRQDRRGRRQRARRQAEQDLQHRAQGREAQDFDDSKWESIAPETLKDRRSDGQVCFCWYRIKITIPPEAAGKAVFFQTTVDDYGEVWVDGKLPRTPGDTARRSSPGSTSPTASSSRTPARQGLPDRGLRHQRTDLGRAHQLDLPRRYVSRHRGQEVVVGIATLREMTRLQSP